MIRINIIHSLYYDTLMSPHWKWSEQSTPENRMPMVGTPHVFSKGPFLLDIGKV